MDDIIKILKNTTQTRNVKHFFFFFDDMITNIIINKNLNPIVTELFIRGKRLKISLVFITQSYFAVPKKLD